MADKTQDAGRQVMVTIRVVVPAMLPSKVPDLQAAIYAIADELTGATVDLSMRAPRPALVRS